MVNGLLSQVMVAVLQFVVGLVLSITSVFVSLKLFDKFTYNIEEWEEIKKGNVAVGILLAAIIISISLVVESGVVAITANITAYAGINAVAMSFAIGVVNLLISLVAAVISVFLAIRILDWITTDIDEMKELKKGNVAVALMMAAVLIAVSFVIKAAVNGISGLINAADIASLGIPL